LPRNDDVPQTLAETLDYGWAARPLHVVPAQCQHHARENAVRIGSEPASGVCLTDVPLRPCRTPEIATHVHESGHYVVRPLATDMRIPVVSWATRRPAGFADGDLAALTAVGPPLARVSEIRGLRRMLETLLQTYIGSHASARVLAGHIRRGHTQSIHAAIWLSDLRGFTALADRVAPPELIGLLNRYFDSRVPAIEARDGEVLKFMGDGLLAIFPIADGEPGRGCAAALAAGREARANILALRRELTAERSPELPFSLALHVGEVLYGNVGGGRRLDFTVIGPAVNLTARLERLARDLGRSVIASAEFARTCGEMLAPLGSYVLRGIAAAQPAFGLADESAPAVSNVDL
jgi:adenylate cyclase